MIVITADRCASCDFDLYISDVNSFSRDLLQDTLLTIQLTVQLSVEILRRISSSLSSLVPMHLLYKAR